MDVPALLGLAIIFAANVLFLFIGIAYGAHRMRKKMLDVAVRFYESSAEQRMRHARADRHSLAAYYEGRASAYRHIVAWTRGRVI